MASPGPPLASKVELRRAMRVVRREVAADPLCSAGVRERLQDVERLWSARSVLSFAAVPGEPDLAAVHDRLHACGVAVLLPDASPSASVPTGVDTVDVALVPGVAFTVSGDRLGQGGGWFDRLLAEVRPDCLIVGVCFDVQLVADLPVEAHDVPVHLVVTESRVIDCRPLP